MKYLVKLEIESDLELTEIVESIMLHCETECIDVSTVSYEELPEEVEDEDGNIILEPAS